MHRLGVLLATSAIATVAVSSAALAGGFQRGTADTDILFERGMFSLRSGLTYVNPQRGFETINGQSGDFGEYTEDYTIPSFAVAFGTDPFGCAVTYTESFAAEADYSGATNGELPANGDSRLVRSGFESDEFSGTCRASLDTSRGRFSLLGGVVFEDFQVFGSSNSDTDLLNQFVASGQLTPAQRRGLGLAGFSAFLPVAVDPEAKSGFETGYRIGAAYEKPEIALRLQAMYRSEIEHTATGFADVTAAGGPVVGGPGGLPGLLFVLSGGNPAIAAGLRSQLPGEGDDVARLPYSVDFTTPQSLTVTAQTGIAPGTLLLGSFRWTDWSINETIDSNTGGTVTSSPYHWRDGYTASIGLGRAFTERVAGAVSLGYDRGVSTGSETTYTDLYTFAAGVSLKPEPWSEIRVGALVGYWTDGEQSIEDGAYFDATVGNDFVVGGNASIRFTF